MRRCTRRRTRGATIIDVLVGIAITAVVLGMAIPNLRAFSRPYMLRTASQTVASDMAVARMRAVAQNRPHRVFFNAGDRWWEVQAQTAPGVFTPVGGRRTLPDGTTFGEVNASPMFDTRGMLAAPFTVAVSNGHGTRTVAVGVLGDTTVSQTVGGG